MRHLVKLSLVFALLISTTAKSEPIVESWFTELSGRYARIYPTLADQNSGTSATTWSRGQGTQSLPTYAGVSEVSVTATDVYIRTSGLGFHVMGPWYGDEAKQNLFPNYPSNRAAIYRFTRTPGTPPANKTPTGLGAIGYFVDGIAMFDSRDAFSYSNANGQDARPQTAFNGDGVWNRDAYVNESVTFDPANAHQAGPNHHYHANPPGLRFLLGGSVDYNPATNTYTESPNGKHSPILGWARDGIPIYGPYGFSDPLDTNSAPRRMISGYQKRNLAMDAARNSLPQWTNTLEGRSTTIAANVNGPNVSTQYPLGHYLEDYEYKGDAGLTLGVDFDLDIHNVRFCKTPEYPDGVYAYFTNIEADGTPVFPYNIARVYFGNPTGGAENSIPAGAEKIFEGGPERPAKLKSIDVDESAEEVTITWSSAEGGYYKVESSADRATWEDLPSRVSANSEMTSVTDGHFSTEDDQYYRVRLDSITPFDDAGFDYDTNLLDDGSTVSLLVSLTFGGATPPPSDLSKFPFSLLFDGQPVTVLSRPSQYALEIQIDASTLSNGSHTISATWAESGEWTGTYFKDAPHNVLLLIVDDWGTDSSPIDNNTTLNPGTTFPTMANLQSLAANGLRFTNAYSQPVCSPTRAALLTGRQAFRTGVGAPGDAINVAETTLPDAFSADNSPFEIATYGKWHLGGGDTGYNTLGGWQEFIGITAGGVTDYENWNRNNNGTSANSTLYSTTDQVNEAKAFIDTQETAGKNWFVWMGFNAPHTPFHEPPAALLQGKTGTSNRALYEKSLEALDTEIGRLLQSVDYANTTVILVGDNGTPGQVVQAPYGNGHAKDDLYEGGIHVPMIVRGPSVKVPAGSTTDKFVHVTDLFPTVLELAGVADPTTGVDGASIVPILNGTDTTQRLVVAEKIGTESGRSLRSEAYPDYKLIIMGDPISSTDDPTFEFYNLGNDENELSPLNIAGLTGTPLAAYNFLISKDAEIGGGYSNPAVGPEDTLYLQLPTVTGAAGVPANMNLAPTSITVDGVTATFVARVDQNETADRYWVKCTLPEADQYSAATVTFPDNPNTGDPRSFTATQIVVAP